MIILFVDSKTSPYKKHLLFLSPFDWPVPHQTWIKIGLFQVYESNENTNRDHDVGSVKVEWSMRDSFWIAAPKTPKIVNSHPPAYGFSHKLERAYHCYVRKCAPLLRLFVFLVRIASPIVVELVPSILCWVLSFWEGSRVKKRTNTLNTWHGYAGI